MPAIPRKGQADDTPLGRFRWIIERTNAWFLPFRHLEIRRERRADLHMAFLYLACTLLGWRVLQRL